MTSPRSNEGAAYLLDKPPGLTSRKAAARVAGHWGWRKYGHAGTLDPDATGLLIVLLGKATRLSRFLSSSGKTYSFGMELGIRTDTDDTSGSVLERSAVEGVSREDILKVLKRLTGTIHQRVPDYSAVRVDGTRAYAIARAGARPDTPVRRVTVEGWELKEWDGTRARLSVTVSSGTYVRALARDIGNELGTGAAAFGIVRTAVDDFSLEEASRDHEDARSLLTMAGVMRNYPSMTLADSDVEKVSHGTFLESDREGVTALLTPDGCLMAVAEGDGTIMRPVCVLVEG
ncbi:MAG: tRNA pseudouridine(55) synthase TruB [Candidatus Fermentibacteraceae bacterium]|nr:tRNA pseudouridine(55) synthase TruB [Candidatus Fermentibacteraceae bacterium]MBN2608686.1 tRNA pseudouridine(55) synthase TruB [Candidatus Fermentibacteraceae bacterium]